MTLTITYVHTFKPSNIPHNPPVGPVCFWFRKPTTVDVPHPPLVPKQTIPRQPSTSSFPQHLIAKLVPQPLSTASNALSDGIDMDANNDTNGAFHSMSSSHGNNPGGPQQQQQQHQQQQQKQKHQQPPPLFQQPQHQLQQQKLLRQQMEKAASIARCLQWFIASDTATNAGDVTQHWTGNVE